MKTRVLGGLAGATTAVALFAGCADTGGPAAAPTTPAPAAAPAADATHNAADAAFVQGMIPHHRQAVAMSDLVAGRSAAPEVQELAVAISAAQGPEIEQMNGLLASWGTAGGPMPGMDGAGDMAGMSGMRGMMSPQQMQQLGTLTGPAFDRAWLSMMIEHHTGAVEMSRTELATGQSPEAKALAQSILDAQQAEIARMQALLGQV